MGSGWFMQYVLVLYTCTSKGDPLLFIDRIYTFLEIGELAYEHGILTSKEGLEILKRRGKQAPSSKSVRLAMKGATKAAVSFSDLLTEAHETAAAFRTEHEALGNPLLDNTSQGLQQLIVRNIDVLNVLSSTDISIDKLLNLPFQALSASR